MVKKIYLENFKAFRKAEIDIKPLTIIVGPNSGGKTSLLQSIYLIQQTLNGSGDDTLELKDTINFGDFKDILHQNSSEKEIRMKFTFEEDTSFDVTIFEDKGKLHVKHFLCNAGKMGYSAKNVQLIETDDGELYSAENSEFYDGKNLIKIKPLFYKDYFFLIPNISIDDFPDPPSTTILGSSSALKNRVLLTILFEKNANDFIRNIRQKFENIACIGPIRDSANRYYESNDFEGVGFKGEHAAPIVAGDLKLKKDVIEILNRLEIAKNITIEEKIENKSFELKFETDITHSAVNFADIGCGTSQLFPIVVQLLLAKPNSMLFIEQPETHMHPKIQAEVATLLIEFLKIKGKFVIETHSEYFVERIRTCIMKNPSLANDVIIYYVEQNAEEKQSKITPITINSEGQYSDLPSGYLTNFKIEEIDRQMDLMYNNLMKKVE